MKMTLIKSVLMVALVVSVSGLAEATGTIQDLEGRTSVGLQGTLTHMRLSGDSGTALVVGVKVSYFPTLNWEVGGDVVGSWIWNGDSSGTIGFDAILNYNFDIGSHVVPYLGLGGGVVIHSNGSSKTHASLGGQGGLKIFVTDSAYVSTEYRYRRWFRSSRGLNVHQGLIGLNFLF